MNFENNCPVQLFLHKSLSKYRHKPQTMAFLTICENVLCFLESFNLNFEENLCLKVFLTHFWESN